MSTVINPTRQTPYIKSSLRIHFPPVASNRKHPGEVGSIEELRVLVFGFQEHVFPVLCPDTQVVGRGSTSD